MYVQSATRALRQTTRRPSRPHFAVGHSRSRVSWAIRLPGTNSSTVSTKERSDQPVCPSPRLSPAGPPNQTWPSPPTHCCHPCSHSTLAESFFSLSPRLLPPQAWQGAPQRHQRAAWTGRKGRTTRKVLHPVCTRPC